MNVYDLTNFVEAPKRIAKRWPFISTQELSDFTITSVGGTAKSVILDSHGGAYQLTGDNTTDDHGATMQLKGESFKLVAGDTHQIRWVFELDGDATQSDFVMGVMPTDTSIFASFPTSAICLIKDDGVAVWDLLIMQASGTTTRVNGVFAADLNKHTVVLEIRALGTFATDGAYQVFVYLDGLQVFGEQGGGDKTTNKFLDGPTTEMTLTMGAQNGDGVTKEILNLYDVTIDWADAA